MENRVRWCRVRWSLDSLEQVDSQRDRPRRVLGRQWPQLPRRAVDLSEAAQADGRLLGGSLPEEGWAVVHEEGWAGVPDVRCRAVALARAARARHLLSKRLHLGRRQGEEGAVHGLLHRHGLRLHHKPLERDGRRSLGRWAQQCFGPPLRQEGLSDRRGKHA